MKNLFLAFVAFVSVASSFQLSQAASADFPTWFGAASLFTGLIGLGATIGCIVEVYDWLDNNT